MSGDDPLMLDDLATLSSFQTLVDGLSDGNAVEETLQQRRDLTETRADGHVLRAHETDEDDPSASGGTDSDSEWIIDSAESAQEALHMHRPLSQREAFAILWAALDPQQDEELSRPPLPMRSSASPLLLSDGGGAFYVVRQKGAAAGINRRDIIQAEATQVSFQSFINADLYWSDRRDSQGRRYGLAGRAMSRRGRKCDVEHGYAGEIVRAIHGTRAFSQHLELMNARVLPACVLVLVDGKGKWFCVIQESAAEKPSGFTHLDSVTLVQTWELAYAARKKNSKRLRTGRSARLQRAPSLLDRCGSAALAAPAAPQASPEFKESTGVEPRALSVKPVAAHVEEPVAGTPESTMSNDDDADDDPMTKSDDEPDCSADSPALPLAPPPECFAAFGDFDVYQTLRVGSNALVHGHMQVGGDISIGGRLSCSGADFAEWSVLCRLLSFARVL